MVAIGREVAGGYSCSLGQPRRKSLQDSEGQAHRHVLHLTERTLHRQFGAKSAAAWVQECLGTSRRSRCVAQCGFAARFKTQGGLAKNIGRDGLNHGIGPFVLGADCGRALANRVAEDESQCVTDQKRLASLLQDLLFRNPRKQAFLIIREPD